MKISVRIVFNDYCPKRLAFQKSPILKRCTQIGCYIPGENLNDLRIGASFVGGERVER